MKRKDSLARKTMKLLCALLGIVLVMLLGTTLVFRHHLEQIHYTQTKEEWNVLEIFSAIPLGNSSDRIGGPGSDLLNILLVGQDAREGESGSRSDSMILCTYNKATRQMTLTSFLRDLYVPIPGYGSNRINAAYSFGGMPLLKKTISQNFSVYIDGSIEVDFAHFSEIIDQLGGVELELREDEAEVINRQTGSALTEGVHRLDGPQALAYARIRNLDIDGDVSRTNRQRKVINALVESLRGSGIQELTPVIGNILPMLTTDLSRGQLFLYALEILPHLTELNMESQKVPADGTYWDETVDGMSVLAANMDTQRQYLRDTLLE